MKIHRRLKNMLIMSGGGLFGATVMLWFLLTSAGSQSVGVQDMHQQMLDQIQNDAQRTAAFSDYPRISEQVMKAMSEVPRHLFVPKIMVPFAYLNRPLPIGHEQTISQPFIVALMTDIVAPQPSDIALEIGTGSGYQAAVLSTLVSEVHSVELIPALADAARDVLQENGYQNVFVYQGDGYLGWPRAAPYDVIVVTAAIEVVPPALIEQLAPGGRLIIPIGPQEAGQELILITKKQDGSLDANPILPVRFVPFVSDDD